MSDPRPIAASPRESQGKSGWTAKLSQRLKRSSLGSASKHGSTTPDSPIEEGSLHDAGGEQAPEDEIIGLDMKGKARRRSNASNQPRTPVTPSSVYSSAHSLVSHPNYSPSPANDGRTQTAEDQQAGKPDSSAQSNIANREAIHSRGSSTSHNSLPIAQSPVIKRKEVPSNSNVASPDFTRHNVHKAGSRASQDSSRTNLAGGDEAGLPIASEFLSRQAPPDKRSSLDAARELLGQRDRTGQGYSDGGFNGIDNPTAEEIVARSKYNSSDTTYHEKMAPAVTHEKVEKHVHHVKQEHITRDIHHYHQIHRILPIHEVEVLPAKHYRIVDGQQVEMKPEEVPQSRIDAWESSIVPKSEGS